MSARVGALIALIAGDGIGPEVIQAARQVLTAVGFRARYQELEAGYGCFERCGRPLPPETLEAARRADVVLFGAVTTPAELPDYPSVIITLRRELGLYANLRPFRTVSGLGRYGDENLDILVVRENTEGLYLQAGWREADRAYNLLRRSEPASRRILHLAFQQASRRRGRLTIAHKANVIKPADLLWIEVAREVARDYRVDWSLEIVDALCMKLVRNPARFDLIVAPNFYGDFLSDLLAGVVGSLGICPSANLGEDHALFEPVHGSAPDIAGQGSANPIGAILSGALMLDHLGQSQKAQMIRRAVDRALQGDTKTPDLGGRAGTAELTAAVIAALHGEGGQG